MLSNLLYAPFEAQRMWTNADWAQQFLLTQSAGGPAVDLTGWTIEGEIHMRHAPSRALDLTVGNARLIVTAAAGSITVSLSAADMAALGPGIAEAQIMGNAPGPNRPLITFRAKIEEGIDQ